VSKAIKHRSRWHYLATLSLVLVGLFSIQPFGVQAQTVSFTSSGLQGESLNNPTSLQFGPDGRLYVSQQNGTIYAYNVIRNGPNDYEVVNTETINNVKNIQNHNDDGTTNNNSNRQITGIVVTGTGANPILYVSSSDPRIGAGGGGNDVNLDTNSGVVSRLECVGGIDIIQQVPLQSECSQWEKVDLIRGLPRSEENHSTNGMALDEANDILYLAVGGHTNAGAPSNNFAFTVEYTYASTIVSIDLEMLETMPIQGSGNAQYIYDLPTLDDPTRPNVNGIVDPSDAGYDGIDVNDPWGGNDGLNMAKIDPTGPLQIYSPGWRNLYDIVLTENGRMYGVDNGANGGWGGHPDGEADYDAEYDGITTPPFCTNDYLSGEPGSTGPGPGGDSQVNNKNGLHYIRPLVSGEFNYVATQGNYYYGGHPHPILANPGTALPENPTYPYQPGGAGLYTKGPHTVDPVENDDDFWRTEILDPSDPNFATQSLPVDWPPVPPGFEFVAACDFRNSGQDDNALANYGPSTNGITEYTASNFNGAMQGYLLMAAFNGNIYEVELSADGKVALNCPAPPLNGTSTAPNCNASFASGFGSTPLDVIAQGDEDPFGGTVWAATYGSDNITIFEPADYDGNDPGICDGLNDDTIDEDGDGYTNADELNPLNNTNPCSGASQPADFDNLVEFGAFKRSDALDTDDDQDGIPDVDDSFNFDPANGFGAISQIPLRLEFFNSTGYGYGGIGLTGLMTNGTDDYFALLDDSGDELVFGGTAGIYTDPTVTDGDAFTNDNTQKNGFQFGIASTTSTGSYTIESQINGPFFNNQDPQNFASHGIYIGTGDQDNYLKFVLTGNVPTEQAGFQILFENNGSQAGSQQIGVPNVLNATALKLYLSVDPVAGTVQASYAIDDGPRTDVGNPVTLSGDVLAAVQGTYTINSTPSALAVGTIATSNGTSEFSASWDYFDVYQNPSNAQAIVSVNTGGINGSTFGDSSFQIENIATNGAQITNVTFDLSSAVIPEVVFDPDGTAGDGTAKDFTPNNGTDVTTGVTSYSYSNAYEGGFFGLSIDFDDFDPSETLEFGLDIDPVSIKGGTSPGPNQAGSVSGVELTGATATVTFDTGETWVVDLFRTAGSDGNSTNIARNALPQPVSINMTGVDNQTVTPFADQEIIVTGVEGSVGKTVRLLQLEAGLFVEDLDGPNAGVGYDVDDWEVNSVIAIAEYTDTVSNSNEATFDVTLTDGDPEAGYNLFVAVIEDADGATSQVSNVILVEYDADAAPTVLYRVNSTNATIPANDTGPDWVATGNTGAQSGNGFAVTTGSISTHNISGRDASVPDYVPQELFAQERWDPATAPDMEYTFTVAPGTYTVNLFMGNGFGGTSTPGTRVFGVLIEGQAVPVTYPDTTTSTDIDLSLLFGHQVGGLVSYTTTVNDGTLNIYFTRNVENPTVNGIEILQFGGGTGQQAIIVDPISDQTSQEGDDISNAGLFVAASGGDGNLSYSATGLPDGVDIEPTNGQITGVIADGASADSPYNVVITVDDDDANTDDAVSISFEWTVTEPVVIVPGDTLYRVNTGGPELPATDGGPVWSQDTGNLGATGNSPYLADISEGTSTYSTAATSAYPGPIVADASVPSYVPLDLFETERYDPAALPEMLWQFPVPAGTQVEIRLYFAEIFNGIEAEGDRIFDVSVDGVVPPSFDDLDPFALVGASTGIMRSFVTTSDGVIDLEFIHVVENPAIKGIEIIAAETEAPVIDPIEDITSGVLGLYETGRLIITATDPQGDDVTFSASGLPDGLTIDPSSGEITGTISIDALTGGPASDGVHEVTITATDDSPDNNSSDATFIFTVVERTITILSPADGATVPSSGFTIEWESTGGATDVFEHIHVMLLGGPYTDDGFTRFGSQPLNGSVDVPTDGSGPYPDLPPGDYEIQLRWAYPDHVELDLALVPPTSINVTIADIANLPPEVTNPGEQNSIEGQTVNLPIVATLPETGQTLSYGATGLPPSLSIDSVTGVISGTLDVATSGTSNGAFIEQSGLVVIEMESADNLPGNWETNATYSTTFSPNVDNPSSATGGDFIIWQGSQFLGSPGNGLITYQVQINNPGVYQFKWRNQVGNGTVTTEHNDTWLKIEADAFYGVQGGTSIVCPAGYDPAENDCTGGAPQGAGSGGWFKVYSSGANNWSWSTNTSDNDAHEIFARFDAPGTYNILISARSNSHAIDRMVLVNEGLAGNNGQSLSLPESERVTNSGNTGSAGTYNVTVTVSDDGTPPESTDTNFVWNVTEPVGVPSALVQVNAGGGLGASTFGNNSFVITNTGDLDIVNVTINTTTAYLPDVVFDPVGTAGDNGAKCLTTGNAGDTAAEVGLTVPGDGGSDAADCESVFAQPHNGVDNDEGYDVLTLDFTDFNAGEVYAFGVDMDPTSIKGDLSTGDAGSISGFELIGTTVTIEFEGGITITTALTDEGSLGGSEAVVQLGLPAAPSIAVTGLATTSAAVTDPNQTIVVSGTVGSDVTLLQVDARLYIDPGNPSIGYDIDPFEANEAMAKVLYTGTIPADGTLEIPVTLLETVGATGTPDGGINHFIAFNNDNSGNPFGPGSNVIVLELTDVPQLADLTATFTIQSRTDLDVPLSVDVYALTDSSTPVYSFTPTATAGSFTVTGMQPGTYEVAVKYSNSLQVVQTLNLVAGSNPADFGTLPAGDANDDNQVTGDDFTLLASTFNLGEGAVGYDERADFDGDGAVTGDDFTLLADNFNVAGEVPDGQ